ncbi:MAG: hypothetical protein QXU99_04535 [Candidatus Bathyarchaeia archaeon]
MEHHQNSKHFDYNVGAIITVLVSIGAAAIAYSLILPFNFFSLPAWIFCPLGAYTIVYALKGGGESAYYLVWGTILFAVGLVSGFYTVINPFVILGVLAIVIAIIGILLYQRSKK